MGRTGHACGRRGESERDRVRLRDRIPERNSAAELFYVLLLLATPELCFVEYPRMVFKMSPWVCSSQKQQYNALVCVHSGLEQTAPPRAVGSHLYPLLLQVNAVCQVLAGDDIWVLVLMEKCLQGLQLILGEYGAMPACPALDLVESLQLARAPLGTLADPDCRVEELHRPGEPGVCRGRGAAAALGVRG